MNALDGVRVLVTGGTSGLGHAMSEALAAEGARVAITGRDQARVESTAREIGKLGGEVMGVPLDVRDDASVDRCVAEVFGQFGGLEVLVNNAGIGMKAVNPGLFGSPQPFWSVRPEAFRNVMETNVTGYFLVARAVVPRMIAVGRGKVINISTSYDIMQRAGFVPYGPSRAATEAMSRIMAADLAGTGVTVKLLLPGGPVLTGFFPDPIPPQMRTRLLAPSVMAAPIVYLCSPAADQVNDERIVATEFKDWLSRRETPLAQ